VTLWGETWPSELEPTVDAVHPLSSAAKAFKAQALCALAQPAETVGSTETFRSGIFASVRAVPHSRGVPCADAHARARGLAVVNLDEHLADGVTVSDIL